MTTIIGAGLGGLTLAAILHRNGAEVALYDGEDSSSARRQGGMLDLHAESGQAALQSAGLGEEFEALIVEGGDATRVLDKNGNVWIDQAGNGARPEVHRADLRRLLLSALPPDCIHWGQRAVGARALRTGEHEVTFADGTAIRAQCLVGADGARSQIRPLLSEIGPIYSGASFIEARIRDAPTRHPELAQLVGSGSLFALSDDKGLFAHCEPDGEICVYVGLKVPLGWTHPAEITRSALLQNFDGWEEPLRALIARSDSELLVRPIYALPVGHRWERRAGVTLIGDAAHLMSPFAGEGANLAMQDGAELAAALLAHPGQVEAAFAAYEAPMFIRSARAAAHSAAGLEMCLSPTAPSELTDFFLTHVAGRILAHSSPE
jgi:2-polyprenyl-6-methoxyphenol hydroxylase-like FAD-dependent oxidoreductase